MTRAIGLLTSSLDPALTDDDRSLLIPALAALGIGARAVVWDAPTGSPAADTRGLDALVFRSCWNYHLARPAFERWVRDAARSGPPLYNPAPVALWNLDKRYLIELAARGVAIPKTVWLEAGTRVALGEVLARDGLTDAVVKPAVSMLGADTWRTSAREADAHQPALDALLATRDVLLQEFVPEILSEGELSLVFAGGAFSHAVRKRPRAGEFRIHEEHGGRREAYAPSPAQIAEATRVVRAAGAAPLLYARVDAVPVGDRLVLMELELIDPSMFLRYDPASAGRFARAIAAWLERPTA